MTEISDDEIAWQSERHENWDLADELEMLIPMKGIDRAEQRRRINRQQEIQDILVERFARQHGWRRSRSNFSLACLARGGVHDGIHWNAWHNSIGRHHQCFDHPYYFRLNRRAVAVAAHLYGWPHVEPECRALAAEYGVDIEEVTDFPSWWYPGSTTLVLWTGAVARQHRHDDLAGLADAESHG